MSSVSARARRRVGWRRDASGATALEFALVAPVLFALLIAIVQLGWALHCAASVRWSLETNARTLLLNPATTADQLKAAMVAQLSGLADSSNLTVGLTTDTSVPAATVKHASSIYQANISIPMFPAQSLVFTSQTNVPTP